MKEYHIFYAPDIAAHSMLPPEESSHAVRVLRMGAGAELLVTDGAACLYECVLEETGPKGCRLRIENVHEMPPLWNGSIELAVAPTKSADRTEWLAEKATEMGMDSLTLLCCRNSERRTMKEERLERILVSAMKQSHKVRKPILRGMTDFMDYIHEPFEGQRFIAHCYKGGAEGGDFLLPLITAEGATRVLIGPEGDFSPEEVEAALAVGYHPISLGNSRLRTETAALAAVHMMGIAKRHCPDKNETP